THCSLPCKRTLMSPVGSPHVRRCPRKLSTSYYGGCWPDLAPGLGDCWPIPAVMGINPVETCGPATHLSASAPLSPLGRPRQGLGPPGRTTRKSTRREGGSMGQREREPPTSIRVGEPATAFDGARPTLRRRLHLASAAPRARTGARVLPLPE